MDESLKIINEKYLIIKELTNGEFGRVFKAKHKLSNSDVVIKLEKKNKSSLLLYETKMYNYLKNYNYISKIRNFYNDSLNNILIIDYHGESIYDLKSGLNSFQMREKIYFVNNLTIHIIDALCELHKLLYIYRDVKPQNFCYNKSLKLIDLGFCVPYLIDNNHILNTKLNKIIGTPNYISKNVLELNTPSRRDDIESVFYIYLFLIVPCELWIKYSAIENANKKDITLIFEIINNINNDFYKNHLNVENLKKFLMIIRNTKFEEIPNYNTFKTLIKGI